MATTKPRIAITLEPEHHAVLERLAALQGRPMSRIVAELVSEMAPVLGKVVETMELAAKAQGSLKENLRRAVDQAEADMLPHAQAVLSQYEAFTEDVRQLGLQLEGSTEEGGKGVQPDASPAGRAPFPPKGGSPRPVTTGATEPQRRGKKGGTGGRRRAA